MLALKRDTELRGSAVAGREGPMFLTADTVLSTAPDVIEAVGNVEGRQAGQNVFADRVRFDRSANRVEAEGNVRLERADLDVTGDRLELMLDTRAGTLTNPVYELPERDSRGQARLLEVIDDTRSRLSTATYTTCPVGNDDWFLAVDTLDIDQSRNVAVARNATLRFLGAPILYTPWISFPLRNERKTGVLAPTLGTTERSGLDILVPYYLNLAPNYDATLYPRLLSRRGIQLGGEFRYLLPSFSGEVRAEFLPNDRVADRNRWSLSLRHTQRLGEATVMGLDFNRVSDDDYFRDLSNLIAATSQTNLNRELWFTHSGRGWSGELRLQGFQTLQDSTGAPITEPYARLPHARINAAHSFDNGLEFRLDTQATRFAHPTLTEGVRTIAYPTLRLPLRNEWGFLTPQAGWHVSHYALDASAPDRRITRSLPILSVDAGVTFERPFRFAGEAYTQTLEPRAYYVYAPFRDQSAIPVFDTAALDFSYAQMFTENQFVGGDRINDANQLTLAATSRFIEAASGLERLQVTLGQRFYFDTQQVTLPGVPPRTTSATDLLLAAGGQLTRAWRADLGLQVDTERGNTIRQNVGVSYRPAPGRVINFGYRFIDNASELVDLSAQWPLAPRWYGMFRYNYSTQDRKLIEGLAGLEYNGGCWAMRGVFQRLATKENQSTDAFFIQLELSGMGRIGSNPLDVLQQSVPGYVTSNEIPARP